MLMNPLQALARIGQSIWLDYIRRGMTRSGELTAMVVDDGLRGMTSNPSIFQQAIAGSDDYADLLHDLCADPELDAKAIYERLAIEDIREAADVLRSVYDATDGADGFVSLEVSPSLGRDTHGTLEEARRLWKTVDRPNLMIKVPGTPEGCIAIERLLAEGINVNVTLLFSQAAYSAVAEAYVRALEIRAGKGEPVDRIASVASFFVSRIDSEIDGRLEKLAAKADADGRARLQALHGKAAIANAKLAYADVYQPIIESARWKALAAKGARPQRLLWASTGTKNKAYSDVLYVDELIGPDTVNTAPPATVAAFKDHGKVAATLVQDVDGARKNMKALADAGIDFDEVTALLLERGLDLFRDAMDGLLATVAVKQRQARGPRLDRLELALPGKLSERVSAALADWDRAGNTRKLFDRDAALWTGKDEAKWLGWIDVVDRQKPRAKELVEFAAQVKADGTKHVLLLGMGGSSLCPDVLARTYGEATAKAGWPKLRILDSTVPAQVQTAGAGLDPAKTLYVVASKSGTTLEPKVFLAHFLASAKAQLGAQAGQRFVAITDPGSKLQAEAGTEGFRRVFAGEPAIGGRYSALSDFGLVPAALMGLPVERMLAEASLMMDACRNAPIAADNPGVALGVVMGVAALAGRDKLTVVASPGIASVGAWLEQLVAESTGKDGKAIIPVDGETLAAADSYGDDRLFVHLRLRSTPDASQDRAVAALVRAGQPVVRIELDDTDSLPQEFFRWEIATAVAGAVMKLNPFDQPDVEASKIATRAMTDAVEKTGALPDETPIWRGEGVSLFTDGANAAALGKHGDLAGWLRAHFDRVQVRDYVGLLAYIEMNAAHERAVQSIRHALRHAKKVATCLGFGPRFLHSTGQAYKGGPNTGVFLQITADAKEDVPVPGSKYGFATIAAAQARGDFEVLAERKRRALRVHLGPDVASGLATLERALRAALA
jgi:transaldolase/glucose-6-phosphate isomerase